MTEGGSVVVLVKGAQPVAWFTVPSDEVSLSCLDYESVAATDGVLTLVDEGGDFRSLADPDLAQCDYLLAEP